MGMAINQAITTISNIDKAYRAFTPEEIQALEASLNTMRKYQEIEQILQEPCIIPEGCYPMLKKIREVMEDVDQT